MSANSTDFPAVTAAGFAALRRGDLGAARTHFDRVLSTGAPDAAAWFGLSLIHRSLGASAEESAALDQTLRFDANHLPALVAKGDLHSRLRDRRAANAFYNAALKLAARLPSLPPEWAADLRRVEAATQGFVRDYEQHLLQALSAAGLGTAGTDRFGRALDLLLGKTPLFLQQPKYFYFPELPNVQFFDPQQFAWVDALQRQTEAIRDEVTPLLDQDLGFVPYIQSKPNRPVQDTDLPENPEWGAFFLIKDGITQAANAELCPRTMAALQNVPLCSVNNRTPSVLFSLLRPGAHIPPHHGFMNARLICHLPLIVPPGCALRVGSETRPWREGELVIFDDSIEHEAWNTSNAPRAVLLFDIWRPELTQTERALVTEMLAAIDRFDGPMRQWSD